MVVLSACALPEGIAVGNSSRLWCHLQWLLLTSRCSVHVWRSVLQRVVRVVASGDMARQWWHGANPPPLATGVCMRGLAIVGGGAWVWDRKSEPLFAARLSLVMMACSGLVLLARLPGFVRVGRLESAMGSRSCWLLCSHARQWWPMVVLYSVASRVWVSLLGVLW